MSKKLLKKAFEEMKNTTCFSLQLLQIKSKKEAPAMQVLLFYEKVISISSRDKTKPPRSGGPNPKPSISGFGLERRSGEMSE